MAACLRKFGPDINAIAMALMTVVFASGGPVWAQVKEASTSHLHADIGADQLDAELTRIANEIVDLSNGKPNLAQLYVLMQDACKTAMSKFSSPPSGEIPRAFQQSYCTCDAALTIDDWLKTPDTKRSLIDFNVAPDAATAQVLLAKHRIYEHDNVCGPPLREAK